MRHVDERLRDEPDTLLAGHPVACVEAGKVERAGRVGAHGAVAGVVEVTVKVTHGQLAQGAIHRLAVAQAGITGLPDGAPVSAISVDGEHMVSVAGSLKVKKQRRKTVDAQCGGGQQRALQAMRGAFAQYLAWRPGGIGVVIGKRIEEALQFVRRIQRAERSELFGSEVVHSRKTFYHGETGGCIL